MIWQRMSTEQLYHMLEALEFKLENVALSDSELQALEKFADQVNAELGYREEEAAYAVFAPDPVEDTAYREGHSVQN